MPQMETKPDELSAFPWTRSSNKKDGVNITFGFSVVAEGPARHTQWGRWYVIITQLDHLFHAIMFKFHYLYSLRKKGGCIQVLRWLNDLYRFLNRPHLLPEFNGLTGLDVLLEECCVPRQRIKKVIDRSCGTLQLYHILCESCFLFLQMK